MQVESKIGVSSHVDVLYGLITFFLLRSLIISNNTVVILFDTTQFDMITDPLFFFGLNHLRKYFNMS